MTTPALFYAATDQLAGPRFRLDGDEGRHAAVVRRIGVGRRINVGDGAGLIAHCVVVAADRHGLELEVEQRQATPQPEFQLIVAQALIKGAWSTEAVEAMTEVGVDELWPWQAERSIAKDAGRVAERWRITAREAAKQARRPWIPTVGETVNTESLVDALKAADLALVLHEDADENLAKITIPSRGRLVLVVGPEGGISPAELASFAAVGARAVRMGEEILRAATAGVAAGAVVLAASGRWGGARPVR